MDPRMKDAGIGCPALMLAFNSGDLVFQEVITSRPNRNSATRVVSLNAVSPVTATFPSTRLMELNAIGPLNRYLRVSNINRSLRKY
jgi:hypothetical protein